MIVERAICTGWRENTVPNFQPVLCIRDQKLATLVAAAAHTDTKDGNLVPVSG
jgi:hypothetical protein